MVKYSWELLVLMMINEEVQRVLEDTLLEQNLTREVWWSLDRASSLGWSSGQTEYIQKLSVAHLTERALCYGRAVPLTCLGCWFSTFQVLGDVSFHSLFNINHVLSEQLSLNVLSTINRALILTQTYIKHNP